MKYAAHGKQVKRGSEHVADAADETWAQIIADALNGERAMTRSKAWNDAKRRLMGESGSEYVILPHHHEAMRAMGIDHATRPDQTVHMISYTGRGRPEHTWQRQQDEYACSCGARWDVSDGDEHPATR